MLGCLATLGAVGAAGIYIKARKIRKRDILAKELALLLRSKAAGIPNFAMTEADINRWSENAADYLMFKGYRSLGEYPSLEKELDNTVERYKAAVAETTETDDDKIKTVITGENGV